MDEVEVDALESSDVGAPSVQRARRVAEWLGLLVVPVGLLYAYGVKRFSQLSGADPFIYTGYTVSTADLIARWGYPYYAVRFGFIVPSNLFAELFGAIDGYFALRWFVSVVAAAAFFHLIRRRYTWQIGVVGAVMLLLNPIYIRGVMTMYSTATGVPFVAAACALMLMPGSRRALLSYRICAGVLLGLTINSNPFSLLPITFLVVVWAVVRSTVGRRHAVVELCLMAAAAVAVSVAGALMYWWRFGNADIFTPSIAAAKRLSTGVSPDRESDLGWLNFRPEVWLAPIASLTLLGAISLLHRPPQWYERAATLMPISMWLAYVLHEFTGGNTLEVYFYSSYMLGPTILAFALSIALLNERWAASGHLRGGVAVVVLLVAPLAWSRLTSELSIWSLNGVLPMLALGGALVVLSSRWRLATTFLVIWVCLVPLLLTLGTPRHVPLAGRLHRQDPKYDEVYGNYHDAELDLYALAADFASSVPRSGSSPGNVVFWFPNDDQLSILMQWTYLGPYSALGAVDSPRMPLLDSNETGLLVGRTPRFVVVLSSLEESMVSGEAAILDLGLSSVRTFRQHLQRGSYHLYVSITELVPSSCDEDELGEPLFWSSLALCATT